MRRTRSQLRAAKIAELKAEQAAYDKSVTEAMKVASFARCDAVEQLYELLEIKPERSITRAGKNGTYEVATDKDEVKRSARLIEAVSTLLAAVESQRQADTGRALDRAAQHSQKTLSQRPMTPPTGQLAGLQHAS